MTIENLSTVLSYPLFQFAGYSIRAACTEADLDAVYRLTHDSIVEAGAMRPLPGGRFILYPKLDCAQETIILIAEENGKIIGTVSLVADGPNGLPTDRHFAAETDRIRLEHLRLVSSFRLATDPTARQRLGKALVIDLTHAAFFVAIYRHSFETMLCTINPRHEGIHRRLFGARSLARLDQLTEDGINLGSVFVRIDRETLPETTVRRIAELAGHGEKL